jgi:hypothetical protein
MADKPSVDRIPGPLPAPCSEDRSFRGPLPTEVEIRLRSTERIRVVLQRCERTSAPEHLLVRIRETLVSITSRERPPRNH